MSTIGEIEYEKQPPMAAFVDKAPTMEGETYVTEPIQAINVIDTSVVEVVFLVLFFLFCVAKLKSHTSYSSVDESNYNVRADPDEARWSLMTVDQIMTETEKSERVVKAMLARRGIKCLDYDGKTISNEFGDRMRQKRVEAKSEEGFAISLLSRLGIDSRVVHEDYGPSIDSSEFKRLKEEARAGTASAYIRKTTIDGLILTQKILMKINTASAEHSIDLSASDKVSVLKKMISDETMWDFCSVDSIFEKELFKDLFANFKNSEVDALCQLINYRLYRNANEGERALQYDINYFFRLGYLSNRKVKRSPGVIYESDLAVEHYIYANVKNSIDKTTAKDYLVCSIASAEKGVPVLLEGVKKGDIKKSLNKFLTTRVTPIYFSCVNWTPDMLEESSDLHAVISESPEKYLGLRNLLDMLKGEKSAKIDGLKHAADSGEASIAQLKKLHDLVSSPSEKFKYLAKACQLSLKDRTGKTILRSSNAKKLIGYVNEIDKTEYPHFRELLGSNFEPDKFAKLIEAKASLRKILNKSVKSGKISESISFEILSSDLNFFCPACAETVGSNITVCPYCQHKLTQPRNTERGQVHN